MDASGRPHAPTTLPPVIQLTLPTEQGGRVGASAGVGVLKKVNTTWYAVIRTPYSPTRGSVTMLTDMNYE